MHYDLLHMLHVCLMPTRTATGAVAQGMIDHTCGEGSEMQAVRQLSSTRVAML
jgi:hypothetical protein